ncbi:MerE [Klebsiella pneumoniae]|nr:MerE [Klebsiella pneumoniae]SWD32045.1 MerE [Klebsiella pneumoniae]SWD89439.1 MerE [Klebsiella pneumoniae]SWE62212.1 MerE [Klebsiella pneumoniae]
MNSPEHLPSETHKPITGALLQIVGGDKLIIPFC